MIPVRLIDTGPLVALLDRRDKHHAWAKTQVSAATPPFLTCESVLSEACFLLQHISGGPQAVLEFVQRGLILPTFSLAEECGRVGELLARYANVPMDLADACLVRLAELAPRCVLLTTDSDFSIYRRQDRSAVPAVMPEEKP